MKMEAGEYIRRNAPGSRLSPGYLVETCLEHGVDICLVLAQGHLESHFGTTGKAAKTNSVWNVVGRTYDHPDSSLVPYLSTLNGVYLSDGRTVDHLLASFTTTDGKRYAEHAGYERRLASVYWKIRSTTGIHECQKRYMCCRGVYKTNNK